MVRTVLLRYFPRMLYWQRRARMQYAWSAPERLLYPREIFIDVANVCNIKCIMCPQSRASSLRPKKIMTMDECAHIIDQVCETRPVVCLFMSGEPLLNPDLAKMVNYAKEKKCIVIIYTNATLLTQEMSAMLLDVRPNILRFSFEGCSQEVYEQLRVGASFCEVKRNIEYFLMLRKKRRQILPFADIEIIRMKQTAEKIPTFIQEWKRKGIDRVRINDCMDWRGLVDNYHPERFSYQGFCPCNQAFSTCSILADGTVVACCLDVEGVYSFGNIFKESFEDIWYGEAFSEFRQMHVTGTIPAGSFCYQCPETDIKSNAKAIKRLPKIIHYTKTISYRLR